MKLLLCTKCLSVFSLHDEMYSCRCGEVSGRYIDNVTGIYSGTSAVPLGFNNSSFFRSVRDQPQDGMGLEFGAFVIPKECATFQEQTEENQKTYEQLIDLLREKKSEIEDQLEHDPDNEFLRGQLSGLKTASTLTGIYFASFRSNQLIDIEID